MYISDDFKDVINKYMKGVDMIYWINLDRMEDRKQNMSNILKYITIPNIRTIGIDGSTENENAIYNNFNMSKIKNTKNEYACLLSHLNTIKLFSESSYNIALILEDNICLDFVKYWNKSIDSIIKMAPPDWDIIMLNYSDQDRIIKDAYTLRRPNDKIWIACAYLINNNASNKLIKKIYKNNLYTLDESIHVADDFIYNNLITYVYKYPYFIWSDNIIPEINNIQLLKDRKNIHIDMWEDYYKNNETFVNGYNSSLLPGHLSGGLVGQSTTDSGITFFDSNNQILLVLFILYIIVIFIHLKK